MTQKVKFTGSTTTVLGNLTVMNNDVICFQDDDYQRLRSGTPFVRDVGKGLQPQTHAPAASHQTGFVSA